jgi:multisubunit Na+/H+ antiporter MnhB subunit
MNPNSGRRILALIIPVNCIYILAIVLSTFRSPEELRLIPAYMISVLAVNWIVWRQWGVPYGRAMGWKRVVRFCAWVILLVNVPMLALSLVKRPGGALIGSLILSFAFGAGGLWLAKPDRVEN